MDGRRRAFVLVVVLVMIMLGSMVAVSLLFRVQAEDTAASVGASSEQAYAAAMAGVQEVMRALQPGPDLPPDLNDNPQLFKDRLVCDDGSDQWYFTVYSAGDPNERDTVRHGLTDEAGKLNVNFATETNLAKLPGLTVAQAQAIVDSIDADSTALPEGAEQEYYDKLASPYAIRNGPLGTLDELLLVRDIDARLLYGEDANLNCRLDANEDDGAQSFPPDNNDSRLDRGLRQYLTVVSYDLEVDNDGVPRTNLNDPDDPLPTVDLPPALTNYIAALRNNKIAIAHAADLLEAKGTFKDASGKPAELESGVGKAELPLLLDLFTTKADGQLNGLINVNTAPAPVLATVPGIDDALAEALVSARRNMAADRRKTIAWLYGEGVVEAAKFKELAPRLTARSFTYSFQVVGYGVPSGRYRVLEVTVDTGQTQPVILYLRDLTRLGMPFAIDVSVDGAVKTSAQRRGKPAPGAMRADRIPARTGNSQAQTSPARAVGAARPLKAGSKNRAQALKEDRHG